MSLGTRARARVVAAKAERAAEKAFGESEVQFNGYRNVYLYHVRKTAGTALNHSFFKLSGEDPSALYRRLTAGPGDFAVANDIVFVVWNKRLIERGHFHYAASHYAMHEINVPPGSFTITCLRDPIDRVISFYRMFLDLDSQDPAAVPPWFRRERTWLGDSFLEFLDRLPPGILQHQLHMFSRSFSVDEALHNIASCSHVVFMDRFEEGLGQLSTKLGVRLPNVPGVRKSVTEFEPTKRELAELKRLVDAERRLVDRAQAEFLDAA